MKIYGGYLECDHEGGCKAYYLDRNNDKLKSSAKPYRWEKRGVC